MLLRRKHDAFNRALPPPAALIPKCGKDFDMSLATWFKQAPSTQQLIAWAVDVARGCHAKVGQRFSPLMYDMTLPEARGYIRARAAEVVEAEVLLLEQRTGCQPASIAIVKQRAAEEV